MQKRFSAFALTIFIFASWVIQSSGVSRVQAAPKSSSAAGDSTTAWVDTFSAATLDARWSWVREDPALWSLTAQPGYLQLTGNGTLFGAYDDAKNILLTPAPAGDFRLVTHMQLNPVEDFQTGGLILYQDDDHYLTLTRDFSSVQSIEFNKTMGGDWSGRWDGTSATDVYLRIDRHGSEYAGFWSHDGAAWTNLGSHTIDFASLRIGVYGTVSPGAQFPISVDSISLSPLTPRTTRWNDEFDAPPLNNGYSWVREDPAQWNLTGRPGFLRILSDSGSLYSTYNSAKNILLRPAPAGDFRITTHVDFAPSEDLQSAGILIYQDDDNYLQLRRSFSSSQLVELRRDTAAHGYEGFSRDVTANSIYLRIDREGTRYDAAYSEDGSNWYAVASANETLSNLKIGLIVDGGPSVLHTPADFAFLKIQDFTQSLYLPIATAGQPAGWSLVNSPTNTPLNGMAVLSPTNIWVAGANRLNSQPKNSTLLQWNGAGWQTLTSPTTTDILSDVDFLTPSDGWLVGTCRLYHWNGAWTSFPSPSCNYINAVDMVASNDVWASSFGAILHYNGSNWSISKSLPGDPWLGDIKMVSATDGWVVTYNGNIYRWNGSAWNLFASFPNGLNSIAMLSTNEGWIAGSSGTILRWNGSAWSNVTSPSTGSLVDISMSSSTSGWIVGYPDILSWDGNAWTKQTNPTSEALNAVEAITSNEAWAVGWNGVILHYQR
jgi:regulation of enolase protein 1 (concanavalin A-like superfamily)